MAPATYAQAKRPLGVTTPLGTDVLLATGLSGREGISELFHFQLDLLAEKQKEVAFDKLLGQKVSARLDLPGGKKRYFSGICVRAVQGESDVHFTNYRLEIVPQLWLWTKRSQSRIFQHLAVPDILKKVLAGLDVAFELQGTFQPRDYCVQYRESDFHFASRMMEEEGIYYFFKHTADGHKLVLANTPSSHPDLPEGSKLFFDDVAGGGRDEERVFAWEKMQEMRSGKATLWDHCFELPHKHLEADKMIQESVQVGKVTHKLKVGANDKLEIYDYPGAYAQRFDGIDRGGGERPAELQKIFQDNKRTVEIRMQEEALPGLVIHGSSRCRQMVSGHKFSLDRHLNANGDYVITGLTHTAQATGNYRTGEVNEFNYANTFTCIPLGLPFRPPRNTPKPVVPGTQTAVVVGPAGEEIFTDKYGRVKVQFHWDREGKNDANSSCWVRVATLWAGKQWGVIHIPRVGQEVVVDFLEGDPDQPIIVGSVYNADMMPPYNLPESKTQSGVKSRSTLKGVEANFNEFRFEDKKGEEEVYLHAEKNSTIVVENDEKHSVGHDRKKSIAHDEATTIGNDRTESVGNDETIQIGRNRSEQVGKDESITIGANRNESVAKDETINIGANKAVAIGKDLSVTVNGADSLTVKKTQNIEVGASRSCNVTKDDALEVGKNLTITAGDQIVLKTGDASITMKKNGDILIKGNNIKVTGSGKINVEATGDVTVKGSKVKDN